MRGERPHCAAGENFLGDLMDVDVSPLSFSSLSLPLLSSLPLPSLILSLSPAGSLYASMDGKCGKKQEVCRRHLVVS